MPESLLGQSPLLEFFSLFFPLFSYNFNSKCFQEFLRSGQARTGNQKPFQKYMTVQSKKSRMIRSSLCAFKTETNINNLIETLNEITVLMFQ